MNTRPQNGVAQQPSAVRILIDFACNDPDNGNFTGRCDKIELPGCSLTLESRLLGPGIKVDFTGNMLSFGHLKLPHYGHKAWVGNWCWDGCWLTLADTVKLLTYIKTLKYWACDGGLVTLCDAWEGGTLTEDMLRQEFFPAKKKEAAHA